MSDKYEIMDPQSFRPTGIKNLTLGLAERGKIKIGKKGSMRKSSNGNEFQMPEKLDHFIVTSMEKDQSNNFMVDSQIMSKLGPSPKVIPIRLVYDDVELNFPSRYACYSGKTLWCTGDGEQAKRVKAKADQNGTHEIVQCPCPRQDPLYDGKDKCKITGTLSAIIDGADVIGGVWKFRTTSYNSVVNILASLTMIKRITGGRLAGVPLKMKLAPKAVSDPKTGAPLTAYVVSVEYEGSVESLRSVGYQALREDKEHGVRVELLENHARKLLSNRVDELELDADEIVSEFFPEQAAAAGNARLVSGPQREAKQADPQAEPVDSKKVMAAIKKAKSTDDLEALRPDIRKLEGDEKQAALLAAKNKAEEIRSKAEAQEQAEQQAQSETAAEPEQGGVLDAENSEPTGNGVIDMEDDLI